MGLSFKWRKQIKFGAGVNEDGIDIDLPFIHIKWERTYAWDIAEPKRLVVAGSQQQFLEWCVRTSKNPRMFRYLTQDLLGRLAKNTPVEIYHIRGYVMNPAYENFMQWGKQVKVVREIYDYE
ncbi:MAG: hypothetical protein J7559_12335 [Cohnella sp.]|nr:hypothetical protein [Cohnella sp.]